MLDTVYQCLTHPHRCLMRPLVVSHLEWHQTHDQLVVFASNVVLDGVQAVSDKRIDYLVLVEVRPILVVDRGYDIVVDNIPDFNDFSMDDFGQ